MVFESQCRARRVLGRFEQSCPLANIQPERWGVLRIGPAAELPRTVHGEDRPFPMLVGRVLLGAETRLK